VPYFPEDDDPDAPRRRPVPRFAWAPLASLACYGVSWAGHALGWLSQGGTVRVTFLGFEDLLFVVAVLGWHLLWAVPGVCLGVIGLFGRDWVRPLSGCALALYLLLLPTLMLVMEFGWDVWVDWATSPG
jgi:hypothetical protein